MKWKSGAGILFAGLIGFATFAAEATPGATEDDKALQRPDLRIAGWTVFDLPEGNGDGGLQPGETATIQLFLTNLGNEPAFDVTGTLAEMIDHPDVTVLDKFASWPTLESSGFLEGSQTPSFAIRVAGTRPCGWQIPLQVELTATGGYSTIREFLLELTDPRQIDLAQVRGRPVVYGAQPSDYMGSSSVAGDLDGDGVAELVLGTTGADGPPGREDAGQLSIVWGRRSGLLDTDMAQPHYGVTRVTGADFEDYLGGDLAVGDLDGDGMDDLVMTSFGADGPGNARADAGEAAVLYGSTLRRDVDLSIWPVQFLYGADAGDELFFAATGDLDGDGFDEVILGSQSSDGPGNARIDSGEVAIVYGGPTESFPQDIDLANPPANVAFVYGADVFVSDVAAGDLDGDGYDDLIVSMANADGPSGVRDAAGNIAIVYGGPERVTQIDLAAPPEGVAFVYGPDSGSLIGVKVATGDLDADGRDELIARMLNGTVHGPSPGEFAVIYGEAERFQSLDLASSPPNVRFVSHDSRWNGFSGGLFSVETGDLDGDGYDDLLLDIEVSEGPLQMRTGAGGAVVIFGRAGRITDIDLTVPPADLLFVHAADEFDQMGGAGLLADIDGDGIDDLVIGAVADGPQNTRQSAGEAVILPGAPRSRYRAELDAFAFVDATVGLDAGLACDDCSTSVPIGFTFDFFGRRYDEVSVSSNGYLTFGEGPGGIPVGACPPASNPPNDTIAVFWDDLNPAAGGGVYYLLEGAEPDRRLTIEWHQVPLYPATDAATFEVTLFESSDQLLFQYLDVNFGPGEPATGGGTAVVGVENAIGVAGTPVTCGPSGGGVADGSAVRLRRSSSPTRVFGTHAEFGSEGWTTTGLWHQVLDPQCAPSARSGQFSWYYGQDFSCSYDTGGINAGILTSPTITALPQDATLEFWQRREIRDLGASPGTANDDCADANGPLPSPYRLESSTAGATTDPEAIAAPSCGTQVSNPSAGVWYTVVGTGNRMTATTCASPTFFDTQINVYCDDCGGLSCVTGNDDQLGPFDVTCDTTQIGQNRGSTVSWCTVRGTVYRIFVHGYALETGSFGLVVTDDGHACADAFICGDTFRGESTVRAVDDIGRTVSRPVLEQSGGWRSAEDFLGPVPQLGILSSEMDLARLAGRDVTIEFTFDSVDAGPHPQLGWMVDDIEIRACPVYDPGGGAAAAAEARATAQPPIYCEGNAGRLDALGSYCTACPGGLSYQWREGASPIPGATSVTYTIPAAQSPGMYDYSVAIDCLAGGPCAAESNVAEVSVVRAPEAVGPTLRVDRTPGVAELRLSWTDVPGAASYEVISDTSAAGQFQTLAGAASSGAPGATIPLTELPLVFYRAAGANSVCGTGPLN